MEKPATQINIPLVDYNQYADSFKDPQPVAAKHPTSAWIYLTTRHLPNTRSRANNFVLDTDRNNNRIVFAKNTSRISVVDVGFENWFIPNINPRNNNIIFTAVVAGVPTTYSVTIPERYYKTADELYAAILLALNAANPGVVVFSYPVLPIPLVPGAQALECNVNWNLESCSFVEKAQSVCLIRKSITARTTVIGPCRLTYTDYVDVHSSALTQYQKMRSITTEGRSGLVVRAYLPSVSVPYDNTDEAPVTYGNWSYSQTLLQNLSFAFRANAVLSNIDFQLYDMNGDPLYVPPYLSSNFVFSITLQAEL